MQSSSLRQPIRLLARLPATARAPITSSWSSASVRRFASSSSSTSGAGTGQTVQSARTRYTLLGAGAVGSFVAATLLLNPIRMDADHPNNPMKNSKVSKKGTNPPSSEELEGTKQPGGQKLVAFEELQKHNQPDDLWVLIEGNVYDVTSFLENHPGGSGVLIQNAGTDATSVYKPIHPPGTLENNLPPEAFIGPIDPTTVPETGPKQLTADEKRVRNAREEMPGLDSIVNCYDIEAVAEKVLSGTAWAYYRSAADSEVTYRKNADMYGQYEFRPRVLRSARSIDTSTTMLGERVDSPFLIHPAAMARLGHPEGERNLTRAAGEYGIIQGISNNASCSLEEILEVRKPDQALFYQIYLNKDRSKSEELLQKLEECRKEGSIKGLYFTVDAVVNSKRTLDIKSKSQVVDPNAAKNGSASKAPVGVSQAISGYQDNNLVWEDLAFIRKNTKLPIVIKGIGSIEDAELAAQNGVAGIVLSTHGARQLDYAPNPLDVLYEIRKKKPELFNKMEIYVDGGVREGAHIVMALALGAKGVGLGRLPLYANGTYGLDGVKKMCQILHEEVRMTMGMLGARSVDELSPEMVRRRSYYDNL